MIQLKRHYSLALVLIGTLMFSCKHSNEVIELTDPDLLAQSKDLAVEYSTALKKKVKGAILSSGVESAIDFCSLNAIPLTDSISSANRVSFKRLSHKTRNKANKASDFELKLIDDYVQSSSKVPKLFQSGQSKTFYAPIYIDSPLCLNCHGKKGSEITPSVAQQLNLRYPMDEATGFSEGELRGLLKIIYDYN